jgi:hypothetical protein
MLLDTQATHFWVGCFIGYGEIRSWNWSWIWLREDCAGDSQVLYMGLMFYGFCGLKHQVVKSIVRYRIRGPPLLSKESFCRPIAHGNR